MTGEFRTDMLNGIEVITAKGFAAKEGEEGKPLIKQQQTVTFIPYYAWAHRGRGQMDVWVARSENAVEPTRRPTVASESKISASRGTGNPRVMVDGYEPDNSNDQSRSFYHWWPKKGTAEWVELNFKQNAKVSQVEIYWFDDTGGGECRVPASWKLLYKDADNWKEVSNPSGYGVEKDKFNKMTFDAVETGGLRIEIQLQKEWSAGVIEIKVK
jgi:hypothetical protein